MAAVNFVFPYQTAIDATGTPIPGAQLFFYASGSSTPLATYSDPGLTTPNTNPVVASGNGTFGLIYLQPVAYKIVLTDAAIPPNQIWTADPVSGATPAIPFGVDTGSANANVVTGVPGIASLTQGETVQVLIANSNTGPSTLNVNSLGAKQINDQLGNPLIQGALNAGQIATFIYTGTYWQSNTGANRNITNSPDIAINPTGNPTVTLTSFNVQAAAASNTGQEYLVAVGLDSSVGVGSALKVASYVGITGRNGTGDIDAQRSITTMASGSFAAGNYNTVGYEINIDNLAQSLGNTSGAAGLASPSSFGLVVTGASSFRNTAGIFIAGPANQWNRGIAFDANSCFEVSIQDTGSPVTGYQMLGNYQTGIDMSDSTSTQAIFLSNNSTINSRGTGGVGNYVIAGTSGNTAIYADSTLVHAIMNNTLLPGAASTYDLGSSAVKWANVWCDQIHATSNPKLKTNIQDAPTLSDILESLPIKTFQWKRGGTDFKDVEEDQSVQATETVSWVEDGTEIVDGVARLVKKPRSIERPVFDEVPVLDDAGRPVFRIVPGQPETRDGQGNVVREAQPERKVPVMHRQPRMVTKSVTVRRAFPRPGKRIHIGALATDIRDVFAATGVDYAAFKEDGEDQAYQLDQILWLTAKALQEEIAARKLLGARIAALESKS